MELFGGVAILPGGMVVDGAVERVVVVVSGTRDQY